MTEAELAESIYWEAEQYIPFDIQDVNLDYQILDAGTGENSKGTMEVLLVAAKKEKIADYTGVISQAGRIPVIVDVDAFALQNAYEVNYGLEPDVVVVLLNAGASAININILTGDQSTFTRDISIGGNSYTEAVQKELNLPFESARAAERRPAGSRRHRREVSRRCCIADDRERAARNSRRDVRLLQGDRLLRPDRPHRRQRRRRSRGHRLRLNRCRALQHRGSGLRPVQENLVRTRRSSVLRRGRSGAGRAAVAVGSRSEGRGPMIRITSSRSKRDRGKKKQRSPSHRLPEKLTIGCRSSCCSRVLHRLALLAIGRESTQLDAEIARRSRRRRGCTRSSSRCSSSSSARRSCSSASC
jgi:hypothetical protein